MRYRFSLPLRPRCSFTTNIFLDSHWKIVVIEPIEKLDVVSVWDFNVYSAFASKHVEGLTGGEEQL